MHKLNLQRSEFQKKTAKSNFSRFWFLIDYSDEITNNFMEDYERFFDFLIAT